MKLVDTTIESNGDTTKKYLVAPYLYRHIVTNPKGIVVKDYTFYSV